MRKDEPTFQVSREKRAVWQRLTPLAWGIVFVVGLVVVVLGGGALIVGCGEIAVPTPTSTPAPTDTPTPTPTATLTPTPTPTVDPEEPFPAWWSDEMWQDEEGNWWPPEEVIEMVKEHYNGGREAAYTYLFDTKPPDYDSYEQILYEWRTGESLSFMLELLEQYRRGERPLELADWGQCTIQVQSFTRDGEECALGWSCRDGEISRYDSTTGEFLSQEYQDYSGLAIYRMVYDPQIGHWKREEVTDLVP